MFALAWYIVIVKTLKNWQSLLPIAVFVAPVFSHMFMGILQMLRLSPAALQKQMRMIGASHLKYELV